MHSVHAQRVMLKRFAKCYPLELAFLSQVLVLNTKTMRACGARVLTIVFFLIQENPILRSTVLYMVEFKI